MRINRQSSTLERCIIEVEAHPRTPNLLLLFYLISFQAGWPAAEGRGAEQWRGGGVAGGGAGRGGLAVQAVRCAV